MRKERRILSGEFKAKIALEALTEQKTIAQLAEENGIQTSQVSAWKRQLLEQSAKFFEPQAAVKNPEEEKKNVCKYEKHTPKLQSCSDFHLHQLLYIQGLLQKIIHQRMRDGSLVIDRINRSAQYNYRDTT